MHCCTRFSASHLFMNPQHNDWCKNAPLAHWEKELLSGVPARPIGSGDVTFHLSTGDSFTLKDINFDDISPVGANKECISAESFDGQTIYHIPFVLYWTVNTD